MTSTMRMRQAATTLLTTYLRRTSARPRLNLQCFSTCRALRAELIIKVPPMAESINEGTLSTLLKKVGERIEADDEVASIETDKIDVAVTAPEGGILRKLFVEEGDVVTVGQPVALLETGDPVAADSPDSDGTQETQEEEDTTTASLHKPAVKPAPPHSVPAETPSTPRTSSEVQPAKQAVAPTPQAENSAHYHPVSHHAGPSRSEREEKMTRMRKTIATRLKQSQNICASLTTMQEVDMSALIAWRAKYKEEVGEKHGVRLGYMGAFTKAATLAAIEVPQINASIDTEQEIITYRDYVDISIAVSSPKGLITPVVRNTERASIVELEREVAALAQKARDGKLTMEDLQGGNFSISNPGIFGSMFGTPLINYPQAAVFNMNSIMQRPVVVDGKLEIRPMMYITVTYDHRLIDGREAVTFLNIVKKYIQDPARMLL